MEEPKCILLERSRSEKDTCHVIPTVILKRSVVAREGGREARRDEDVEHVEIFRAVKLLYVILMVDTCHCAFVHSQTVQHQQRTLL